MMRFKLAMALLTLGMATATFTSCGDDTPDKGFELTSYLDGNYTPTNDTCHLSATINGEKVSEKGFSYLSYQELAERKHGIEQFL